MFDYAVYHAAALRVFRPLFTLHENTYAALRRAMRCAERRVMMLPCMFMLMMLLFTSAMRRDADAYARRRRRYAAFMRAAAR